ncbi:MAG TPA: phosphate/phosphite/phosphonate ABC transporter substrate-binding protein [Bdellovibrionales bacterium]|nr:phosphate/phosphite/phosphonate ABC transporter substrate-binding protein [Bdellovibrionales bacterium]
MTRIFVFLGVLVLTTACTRDKAPLGSQDNPIKFFFVPSVDMRLLEDTSRALQKFLEVDTPYKYKISIPPSYVAVVEAFGTRRADVAAINTFGYVLAHDKYGAQARLVTIRFGETTYQAQYLVRADSGIKSLKDLNGKKMAFVDPASVSGYLLPLKDLKENGVKPSDIIFAMRHDNVVSMIYQKQVDAGATFYSPPAENGIQDARRLVRAQYPDVEKKIKILALSQSIPNDPVIFRKDLPEEMKKTIADSLIRFAATPEGLDVLKKLSSVTGLAPTTDKDYDSTRAAVKALGGDGAKP